MFVTGTILAVLLQSAGALRRGASHKVGGVPVLNYRYRHLQVHAAGAAPEEYDWILKFKDGLGDEQLEELCEGACKAMGHPSQGGLPLATVRTTERDLEALLNRHPGMVEFVEPDSPVDVEPNLAVEDPSIQQYNLDLINLPDAQFTGAGAHIYVMDTGIRISHRDFGGRAVATVDTIGNGGRVTECSPGDSRCAADSDGHGTHVAGTAGGNTFGVARGAVLHAMKVCCGSGTNINGGMDWIARVAQKPAVMTMSLGSYSTPESSRVAVDAVVNSGVTVTVSAGNRGTPSCEKSYTFIASALGVGATDSSNRRASWSNYGTCNAIMAPGVSIVSASSSSDTGSSTKSGTSMAAPLAAGATALLLEEDPTFTPAQIKTEMRARSTKDVLTGLQSGDPNMLLNVGIFTPTPAPPPTPEPPTPAPGTWELTGSGCVMDGDCISSKNYPRNYGNNENCRVQLFGAVFMRVDGDFMTERNYDKLTVSGVEYHGTPPSNLASLNGVHTGTMTWSSDFSITNKGWKLCRT